MNQSNTLYLLIAVVAIAAIVVAGYVFNENLKRQALKAQQQQLADQTQQAQRAIQDRQALQERQALQQRQSPQEHCYYQAISRWAKDNNEPEENAPLEVTSKALRDCGMLSKS